MGKDATLDLSREDIVSALGPVGDVVVKEIFATGITPVQLAEARVWVVMDRVLGEVGADRRHPVGEVGRAVAILNNWSMPMCRSRRSSSTRTTASKRTSQLMKAQPTSATSSARAAAASSRSSVARAIPSRCASSR